MNGTPSTPRTQGALGCSRRLRGLLAIVVVVTALPLVTPARAITPEQAQLAELKRLRAQVANEVQLAAYDLLDELVYGWTQSPPFATQTHVFLADMTVPVGLGTGLGGLLEDHLAGLLLANPSTRVTLAHCPACVATLVHSGPKGTVISRGLDNPEALARIGGPQGRHGLYVDLTAEGSWLVLRARVTRLTPELPIVWSRTLSAAVGTPSMLRHSSRLKSAAEARQEYLDALNGRSVFTVPVRFVVRTYAAGYETDIAPVPTIWLQTGFELAMTQARAWTASAIFGYAWLPEAYDGLMVQARMSRLISGRTRSLTGPDLYLFFGGALMTLDGPAVGPFGTSNMDRLLREAAESVSTRATFGGLHLGLEFRVGNRIGASVFLEHMPAYTDGDQLGVFLQNDIVDFHSLGVEVSFCF